MSSCPFSNLIGNRCMPDTPRVESLANKHHNFYEEASFFAALFKQFNVRPVPDPGMMQLLQKEWVKRKQRKVTKKEKSEKTGLGKKPRNANPNLLNDDEV